MELHLLDRLPGARGLPAPWTLTPGCGLNNTSASVDTPAGAYVLRVYRNTADAGRVGDEHALLRALQAESLPFAMPCPVPAPTGETVVPVPAAGGRPPAAALFPRLAGRPADASDLGQVRVAGTALGALHGALARVGVGTSAAHPTAVTLLGPDPALPGAPAPTGDPLRLEDLPLAPGQREPHS